MKKPGKLYKKLLKYITAAIIIAVPLYPKFPFLSIPGTSVAIRLEDFLIAFAGLLLIPLVLSDIKKIFSNDLCKAIILYLLIGFISLLSAIYITSTVQLNLGLLHWLRRIEYFVPFLLGIYVIKLDKKNLRYFLNLFFLVIIMAFVYGYGQKNYSWPIIITQNAEYARGVALRYIPGAHINSTFAGHYDLATFLVLVLPIVITYFASVRGYLKKAVYLIVWLAGLWLLVYSASRISLVSYIGGSFLALILLKKYRYILVMLFVSILFVNFSSNLIARYTRIFEVVSNRITYEFKSTFEVYAQQGGLPERRERPEATPVPPPRFEDRSTNIRLDVEWPRAIRAFKKNPLLGTGYSSITLATDNDYLRLLGETGLLGFFAFLLIGIRIFKRFATNYPFKMSNKSYKPLLFGIIGGTAGILVNAVFIDVFEASKFAILFWLIMGMSLSVINSKDNERFI